VAGASPIHCSRRRSSARWSRSPAAGAGGAEVVAGEPAQAQSVAAKFAEAVGQVAKGIAGLARLSILPRIQ
jgi:hypothetical protein